MEPGLMPPTSAWCARLATQKEGRRRSSRKTAETAVMSGRCVPPRNGSFSDGDVARAERERVHDVAHRERHGAEVHGHVVAHGDGIARGVIDRAGKIAALLDIGRERGLAQHHPHLLGDGDQEMPKELEIDGAGFHGKNTVTGNAVHAAQKRRLGTANPVTVFLHAFMVCTRRCGLGRKPRCARPRLAASRYGRTLWRGPRGASMPIPPRREACT